MPLKLLENGKRSFRAAFAFCPKEKSDAVPESGVRRFARKENPALCPKISSDYLKISSEKRNRQKNSEKTRGRPEPGRPRNFYAKNHREIRRFSNFVLFSEKFGFITTGKQSFPRRNRLFVVAVGGVVQRAEGAVKGAHAGKAGFLGGNRKGNALLGFGKRFPRAENGENPR